MSRQIDNHIFMLNMLVIVCVIVFVFACVIFAASHRAPSPVAVTAALLVGSCSQGAGSERNKPLGGPPLRVHARG